MYDAPMATYLKSGPRILTESCPCDTCGNAARCANSGEACLAYSAFCKSKDWLLMPRQPRLDVGERVLGEQPKTA